jgi:prevent-host-death family protein
MTVKSVPIEEAGRRLAELVDLVEQGTEVVILKDAVPKAKIVSVPPPSQAPRSFGDYRGEIEIAADFDAPLPDSYWLGAGK